VAKTDLSWRTAMRRTELSSPMQYLMEHGRVNGKVLDYGCGFGFDCDSFGFEGYDLNLRPKMPRGKFDTIVCIYVLNVIKFKKDRKAVMDKIKRKLKKGGVAYIAVRTDKKHLRGDTRIGTTQHLVELDLPVVHRGGHYIIYRMDNEH